MTITFADNRRDPATSPDIDAGELVALAKISLRNEGVPEGAEVSITLLDEQPMGELNEAHLGKVGPTDVLSFPLEPLTPGMAPAPVAGGPPLDLGDIFICPQVVIGNASRSGVPFRNEMALMVVHGLLHLLGYDHIVDSEAEQMEQRERDLLAVLGLVRP